MTETEWREIIRQLMDRWHRDKGEWRAQGDHKIGSLIRDGMGDVEWLLDQVPLDGDEPEVIRAALAHYGYNMELIESYMHLPRKERPSLLGNWMQRQRNPWIHYVLALNVGKQGHWVVIKGVTVCGLSPPLELNATDHEGGGWVQVWQVKSGKLEKATDWFKGYPEVIAKFVRETAKK